MKLGKSFWHVRYRTSADTAGACCLGSIEADLDNNPFRAGEAVGIADRKLDQSVVETLRTEASEISFAGCDDGIFENDRAAQLPDLAMKFRRGGILHIPDSALRYANQAYAGQLGVTQLPCNLFEARDKGLSIFLDDVRNWIADDDLIGSARSVGALAHITGCASRSRAPHSCGPLSG